MNGYYINISQTVNQDPSVKALQQRYGKAAGLGHWVLLLLELYATNSPSIDCKEKYIREALADEHGMDQDDFNEFIDLCASVKLVDDLLWHSSQQISNNTVVDQKAYRKEVSEKRAQAGAIGGKKSKK